MEHIRLYELKFQQYEAENKALKEQVFDLEEKLQDSKEEVRKWNQKYKELKETLTK